MIDRFALIIGAMKCGTTSLFAYLSQHPEIASCTDKEPCFFSLERNWSKGWDWYQDLWEWDPSTHKVAMEASTSYTRIPAYLNAAAHMATVDARFKFIYVVREPIQRIESHYTYSYANGFAESQTPLSAGIDRRIIEASKYAKQLREYSQRFPKEDILVVPFEALKQDPLGLARKICGFIEVDPAYSFVDLDAVHNPAQDLIDDVGVWRFLRQFKSLKSVTRYIPKDSKRRVRQLLGRPVDKSDFRLSEQQVESVMLELKDDLRELVNEYDVDVSGWNLQL